jgi:hypothetical protein
MSFNELITRRNAFSSVEHTKAMCMSAQHAASAKPFTVSGFGSRGG